MHAQPTSSRQPTAVQDQLVTITTTTTTTTTITTTDTAHHATHQADGAAGHRRQGQGQERQRQGEERQGRGLTGGSAQARPRTRIHGDLDRDAVRVRARLLVAGGVARHGLGDRLGLARDQCRPLQRQPATAVDLRHRGATGGLDVADLLRAAAGDDPDDRGVGVPGEAHRAHVQGAVAPRRAERPEVALGEERVRIGRELDRCDHRSSGSQRAPYARLRSMSSHAGAQPAGRGAVLGGALPARLGPHGDVLLRRRPLHRRRGRRPGCSVDRSRSSTG